MYCSDCGPTYGDAPARPLPGWRRGLGAFGALQLTPEQMASTWYLARVASGPTTTTTGAGGDVIITPTKLTEPTPTQPVTFISEPTPTQPAAQPTQPATSWPSPGDFYSGPSYPTDGGGVPILLPTEGGGAPVTVSVTAPESTLQLPEGGNGFGLVEAALGAALAFLLAQAWQKRGRR